MEAKFSNLAPREKRKTLGVQSVITLTVAGWLAHTLSCNDGRALITHRSPTIAYTSKSSTCHNIKFENAHTMRIIHSHVCSANMCSHYKSHAPIFVYTYGSWWTTTSHKWHSCWFVVWHTRVQHNRKSVAYWIRSEWIWQVFMDAHLIWHIHRVYATVYSLQSIDTWILFPSRFSCQARCFFAFIVVCISTSKPGCPLHLVHLRMVCSGPIKFRAMALLNVSTS
jgi:uncharacterized membrane protein YwzB